MLKGKNSFKSIKRENIKINGAYGQISDSTCEQSETII